MGSIYSQTGENRKDLVDSAVWMGYLRRMSVAPLVRAENLKKSFGALTAVDGINFQISPGECFGFLGPNGAGKSSTMKMLYCVSPRSSGVLEVFGLDPNTHAREIKRHLGVVPQDENLDPDLSVLENLMVFGRYFDLTREVSHRRGSELLDFMQLSEKRKEKIDHLSGGMKRRLLIARALINDPRLIILDEPTTGLDPQARRLVWQKLRQLKERGTTLVLTTHYMEEAERLCDRLVVMDYGRILAQGQPRELIRTLVGREVLEVRAEGGDVERLIKKCAAFRLTYEVSGDTVYFFAEEERQIRDCLPLMEGETFLHRRASLEDVFLKLSGHELRD